MQKDLTKGSALKNIITFSLPFLLANFLQTFYGMADLFIVGQYNGAASLSGVSIGSQVMHMITVMLVGIAMGSTVMIGRYVGERKEKEKRNHLKKYQKNHKLIIRHKTVNLKRIQQAVVHDLSLKAQ